MFVGVILVSIVIVSVFLDQKRKLKGECDVQSVHWQKIALAEDTSKGVVGQSLEYIASIFREVVKPSHLLLAAVVFWINSLEGLMFGIYTKVSHRSGKISSLLIESVVSELRHVHDGHSEHR